MLTFTALLKTVFTVQECSAWDMSDQQIHAVTQYIKTFAPQVWENKDTQPGKPIEVFPDPYGLARKEFAIEKGKEVYHLVANCQSCHRAYVSQDEFSTIHKKYNNGQAPADFDATMYELKMQESEYYFFNSKERLMKILPPDFTWHEVRSAHNVEELYLRIAAGVTGTGMPAWRGVLTEDEIWAARLLCERFDGASQ
jgi:mono/diheme cytochrome c family protein